MSGCPTPLCFPPAPHVCLSARLLWYLLPRLTSSSNSIGYSIDVKDVALLHVAAILDPDVKNARLQAWADPFNWNDLLAIARRLYPHHQFIEDLPGMSELSLTTDFTQQLGLLKKWGGQDGWRTLEQTVEDNLRAIVAWENK